MQQAATAPPKASTIIPAARLHSGSGPPSTSSNGRRSRATQVQSHRNPPANRADRSATNVRVIRTSSLTTLTTGGDPESHFYLLRTWSVQRASKSGGGSASRSKAAAAGTGCGFPSLAPSPQPLFVLQRL